MWWLFSNKKRGNVVNYDLHLHSRIKNIEESLKNSFFNIKKDITKINSFLYHHDNNLAHLKERVLFLESKLRDLSEKENIQKNFEEKPQKKELVYEEKDIAEKSDKKTTLLVKWEDLTNIQQTIFLRLGLLQIESSQKRIAMKHLSEELYPEKEYNDVRSMISDYINLLNEYGLIKKTRKGRQIFLTVTERGTVFYDKEKKKKLLDVLNKHKE